MRTFCRERLFRGERMFNKEIFSDSVSLMLKDHQESSDHSFDSVGQYDKGIDHGQRLGAIRESTGFENRNFQHEYRGV